MRILWISRLTDEISHWNKRFFSSYRCLFVTETKNRKSNFILVLYTEILMRILWISRLTDEIAH